MVLLSIFFTQIRSGRCKRLFFIYFASSMRLLFIQRLKILLQIFLYEDLKHVNLTHTSVGYVSLQNASRTALCYATNTIKWKHSNIWHKSSTKHKEVRPDWNDKNDNANYAPSYHVEGFRNGSGYPFWEIFDQVRKDLDCELFYSELKRHNVSYYLLSMQIIFHRVRKR